MNDNREEQGGGGQGLIPYVGMTRDGQTESNLVWNDVLERAGENLDILL